MEFIKYPTSDGGVAFCNIKNVATVCQRTDGKVRVFFMGGGAMDLTPAAGIELIAAIRNEMQIHSMNRTSGFAKFKICRVTCEPNTGKANDCQLRELTLHRSDCKGGRSFYEIRHAILDDPEDFGGPLVATHPTYEEASAHARRLEAETSGSAAVEYRNGGHPCDDHDHGGASGAGP